MCVVGSLHGREIAIHAEKRVGYDELAGRRRGGKEALEMSRVVVAVDEGAFSGSGRSCLRGTVGQGSLLELEVWEGTS
jgi:hypothetical protein